MIVAFAIRYHVTVSRIVKETRNIPTGQFVLVRTAQVKGPGLRVHLFVLPLLAHFTNRISVSGK